MVNYDKFRQIKAGSFMKTFKRINPIIAFQLILGIYVYFSLIFNDNVWMDEAFSAVLAKGTLKEVLERSAADTLPPLYNLLNFFTTKLLGCHTWSFKLMSVLPMLGCIIISAVFLSKTADIKTSLLYTCCLCAMPQLLYYGVEIRMYALGLFFVTGTGFFAFCSQYDKRIFSRENIALMLFTLGAGYTHHFAFVSAAFIHLFLLLTVRDRAALKKRLLSIAVIAVLYIPCLFTTLQQMGRVSGYFTMPDITPAFIITCIKMPFITNQTILSAILMLTFTVVTGYGIYLCFFKKSIAARNGLILIAVYPATLLFGAAATILLKTNIFTDRYLVPSLGLLWLGFCLIAGELTKYIKYSTAILFCLIFIIFCQDYNIAYKTEYKPGVQKMLTYFDKNINKNDGYIIYEDNYQIEICFRYYFPDFTIYRDITAADCPGDLYYLQVDGYSDKIKEVIDAGYIPAYVDNFSFDRYSFKLYKLTKFE